MTHQQKINEQVSTDCDNSTKMLLINRVCNRVKTDNYSELRFNRISIKKCQQLFPTSNFLHEMNVSESSLLCLNTSHSWRHHSFLLPEQWWFSPPSIARQIFLFRPFFPHITVDDWVLMERRLDKKLFSFSFCYCNRFLMA